MYVHHPSILRCIHVHVHACTYVHCTCVHVRMIVHVYMYVQQLHVHVYMDAFAKAVEVIAPPGLTSYNYIHCVLKFISLKLISLICYGTTDARYFPVPTV